MKKWRPVVASSWERTDRAPRFRALGSGPAGEPEARQLELKDSLESSCIPGVIKMASILTRM
jgi:hypothetical protein